MKIDKECIIEINKKKIEKKNGIKLERIKNNRKKNLK